MLSVVNTDMTANLKDLRERVRGPCAMRCDSSTLFINAVFWRCWMMSHGSAT